MNQTAPQQHFGTAGLNAMNRPSRLTQSFMAIVHWAERLSLRYAVLGNPPVYENLVNWLLMNLAMFTPFIQEGMENHKAWEKKFHKEQ